MKMRLTSKYSESRYIFIIPVDGNWSEWVDATPCSKTCGGGERRRERKCNKPAPANGGKQCQGDNKKIVDCNSQPCTGTINI